jgi:hypothetical protein
MFGARHLLTSVHTVWSPGLPPVGAVMGMPIVPCVALSSTRPVIERSALRLTYNAAAPEDNVVWAWCRPSDTRAAKVYGPRLIADIEDKRKPKPPSTLYPGWKGEERERGDAQALVALGVQAVTSHGWVLSRTALALQVCAEAGMVAVPQIYTPTANSHTARAHAIKCIRSYRAHGFKVVAPILAISVARTKGLVHVRAWADACASEGCNFHLYYYGAIDEATPGTRAWLATIPSAYPVPVPAVSVPVDGPVPAVSAPAPGSAPSPLPPGSDPAVTPAGPNAGRVE